MDAPYQQSFIQGEDRKMACKRCPHHVRHGKLAGDKKTIEFQDRCSLKPRGAQDEACDQVPFPNSFNFVECKTYQFVFKSKGPSNDVIPTSDFQFADALTDTSITDMELL